MTLLLKDGDCLIKVVMLHRGRSVDSGPKTIAVIFNQIF